MKLRFGLLSGLAALMVASCSAPGSSAMSGVKEGMTREQVKSVMASHGHQPDDSQRRPSGGWQTHGQDAFAAGVRAKEFEAKTGHHVEWAEVYHVPSTRGASVINLYYDANGRLVR